MLPSGKAGLSLASPSDRRQRVARVAPGVIAAHERAGLEALVPERERHTGAGGLVQSGAVDGDEPIAVELAVPLFDLVSRDMEGPGQLPRILLDLPGVTDVEQREGFLPVEPSLHLVNADRGFGLVDRERVDG